MNKHKIGKTYSYIESLYSRDINKIPEINLINDIELAMQVSPLEGMILKILLKSINAKNVLEIGTLLGYSTQWLADAVGDDGMVITIEKSSEAFSKARKQLDAYTNIKCVNADAVEYLKSTKFSQEFDAIFIDADKTNYSNYFDLCLPLLKQGGLIIADNTLMYGEIAGKKSGKFREKTLNAIRDFNQKISQSELVDSIIIPTDSGLTIAIKK